MDLSPDIWFILPAVLFTLLAVIIGAVVLRKTGGSTPSISFRKSSTVPEKKSGECGFTRPQGALSQSSETEELISGRGTESESTAHTAQDLEEDSCKLLQTKTASKCETPVSGNDESANISSDKKVGQEDKPLRYMPGMLRTSQLEKMMSKEELEEERRVQREQLTAIFKLLKDNQDSFGEVTEHDMEEQLKLYSI